MAAFPAAYGYGVGGVASVPVTTTSTNPYTGVSTSVTRRQLVGTAAAYPAAYPTTYAGAYPYAGYAGAYPAAPVVAATAYPASYAGYAGAYPAAPVVASTAYPAAYPTYAGYGGVASVPVTTTSTCPMTGVSTSVTRRQLVGTAGAYPAAYPTTYAGYAGAHPAAYPYASAPVVAAAPVGYPAGYGYGYSGVAAAAPYYGAVGSVPVTTTSTCPLTGVSTSVTRRQAVLAGGYGYGGYPYAAAAHPFVQPTAAYIH